MRTLLVVLTIGRTRRAIRTAFPQGRTSWIGANPGEGMEKSAGEQQQTGGRGGILADVSARGRSLTVLPATPTSLSLLLGGVAAGPATKHRRVAAAKKREDSSNGTYADSCASSDDVVFDPLSVSDDDSDDPDSESFVGIADDNNINKNGAGPDGSPRSVLYALMGTPTGEVAYGNRVTLDVLPDIHIESLGTLEFPVTPKQASKVRKVAQKLRTKDWGMGWAGCHPKAPTCIILKKDIRIKNGDSWKEHLSRLSDRATEYLAKSASRRLSSSTG